MRAFVTWGSLLYGCVNSFEPPMVIIVVICVARSRAGQRSPPCKQRPTTNDMSTLIDYYALRAREEAGCRKPRTAALLPEPGSRRRLRRLLRGIVGYRGKQYVDLVP